MDPENNFHRMPTPPNIQKSIAKRQRTGKSYQTRQAIAPTTLAPRLYDQGGRLFSKVGTEAVRFNTRIREYDTLIMDHPFTNKTDQIKSFEINNRDRYKRGLELRLDYLRAAETKRKRLKNVMEGKEVWSDSLLEPIPRPETHPSVPGSPGYHSRSAFRSVPAESQAELTWLGQHGQHGFVRQP